MNINETEKLIWKLFSIRSGDILPHCNKGDRCTLGILFKELNFKIGAEIGVQKGKYSKFLFDIIPDLKLFCIDPWKSFDSQDEFVTQEKQNEYFKIANNNLNKFNVDFKRMESIEASYIIPDLSLDFVYIDANHEFDFVMTDIIVWSKKVRIGGIVSGHDFFHWHKGGVVVAVEAYVRGHSINPWYITREKHPSWFWIKKNA